MPQTAFISYASEDEAAATEITRYLERNRVSCWIAHRDARPGADYGTEIITAIESSAVLVLVLSEHANASKFVGHEVERAVSKGKPIFPVRVREVLPSKSLELFISNAQWVDAWQPPIEQYLDRLADSIRSAAGVYASEPARAAASATAAETGTRDAVLRRRGTVWLSQPRMLQAALVAAIVVIAALVLRDFVGRSRSVVLPAERIPDTATQSPAAASPAPARRAADTSPAATPAAADIGPCPSSLSASPELPTPFTCTCSAQATAVGSLWGTDGYTDDSALCRAALHAGVVAPDGGPITVVRTAGRQLYVGTSRNGVRSSDYGAHPRTIEFKGAAPSPAVTLCPQSLSVNRNLPTPFTCRCSSEAALSGSIWGTDVYTDDSAMCVAAVHAGVITQAGGTITVTPTDGRMLYPGTARNGVTSSDYGRFPSSIRVR